MSRDSIPSPLQKSIFIETISGRTAAGNERETVEALLRNEVLLKPETVYGQEGGDAVPMALRAPFSMDTPPRWWQDLLDFLGTLAAADWGSARMPVFITSSNFGIDGLYGLGKTKNPAYASWSTPQNCVTHIRQAMGWGENITLFSHACVSAQLALYQAAEWLHEDVADKVLVFSFDFVGPFVAAGFHSLKILNDQMPAPYADRESGSIGLGDGMAYAVLSKEPGDKEIVAQSLYNEMYHFTANAPDATGFSCALDSITQAGASERFWVKGHGTGTLEAGKMEASSVHERFPGSPLVSWKGSIGHTLGSCALVELAIAMAACDAGRIPGTVGSSGDCFSPDVALSAFDAKDFDSVLMLSNAFGGAHGAMMVRYA